MLCSVMLHGFVKARISTRECIQALSRGRPQVVKEGGSCQFCLEEPGLEILEEVHEGGGGSEVLLEAIPDFDC